MKNKELPLSPHLQVYKAQMTSAMSIFHRMSGMVLSLGTIIIVWMLLAAATGPIAYQHFHIVASSWIGQIVFLGWSMALFYHMFNGVRHLFWDMGYLFKLKNAYAAGYMVLFLAFLATLGLWLKLMLQ